ncbi:hypothetical protein G7Y79_00022g051280 [Physcia stellaris]|nr:hypothetical protein G7Y79_00022g051280 [Physcia stellaris]
MILVCSTRKAFLDGVHLETRESMEEGASDPADDITLRPRHSLLIPTIHLLAKARSIDLVFTPTMQHLRALLATVIADNAENIIPPKSHLQSSKLLILGLLDTHRPTSEHSAQGLSRTLAMATEASLASRRKLILVEIMPAIKDEDGMAFDENEHQVQGDPWMEQIPILNGSIRSGGDERVWAGRTVEVARIIGRWCRIVKPDDVHVAKSK